MCDSSLRPIVGVVEGGVEVGVVEGVVEGVKLGVSEGVGRGVRVETEVLLGTPDLLFSLLLRGLIERLEHRGSEWAVSLSTSLLLRLGAGSDGRRS